MQKRKQLFHPFLLLCLLFMLSSCDSTPSESLAIDFINNRGKWLDNLLRVKSLKKTNGATVKHNQYVMSYTYEFECLRSNGGGFYGASVACKEAGDIVKGDGQLYFQKTEKGWMVMDIPPNYDFW